MKVKHLLISRVAMYWKHPNLKVSWSEWVRDRMGLYRILTTPSIAAQSQQNFHLVSLIDETLEMDAYLENETVVKVSRESGYPWNNMKAAIYGFLNHHVDIDTEEVIVSRVDSDDLLHEDYVKEIQLLLKPNQYVDIQDSLTYNFSTGKVFKSQKYKHNISPFVSVRESLTDFKCLPYAMPHTSINSFIAGKKSSKIKALQVIHNNNMINTESGIDVTTDFPINKYGFLI